jgi:hypothetical protein
MNNRRVTESENTQSELEKLLAEKQSELKIMRAECRRSHKSLVDLLVSPTYNYMSMARYKEQLKNMKLELREYTSKPGAKRIQHTYEICLLGAPVSQNPTTPTKKKRRSASELASEAPTTKKRSLYLSREARTNNIDYINNNKDFISPVVDDELKVESLSVALTTTPIQMVQINLNQASALSWGKIEEGPVKNQADEEKNIPVFESPFLMSAYLNSKNRANTLIINGGQHYSPTLFHSVPKFPVKEDILNTDNLHADMGSWINKL